MPEPTLNIVVVLGTIVGPPTMGYVGAAHTPRVRFSLTQRRLFRRTTGRHGHEDIVVDCEIWGRQGETFAATVGAGSTVCIKGHMRSYTTRAKGRPPRVLFVVADTWTVIHNEPPHRYARRVDRSADATIRELDLPIDDIDLLRVQT